MIYYKDPVNGDVYAYDQQQVDEGWVKEGLVLMTEQEVYDHLNPTVAVPL
jgi:hypothetical protein